MQTKYDSEGSNVLTDWGSTVQPVHLIDVLKSYRDLGFHPSQGLLTATEPFLCSLQSLLRLESALDLVHLFRAFCWQPGWFLFQRVLAQSGVSSASPCHACITHMADRAVKLSTGSV